MMSLTDIAVRRGREVLISDATLQIHAGQRMGVIGANGCGKSSLFAMFLGELEPDDGTLSIDPRDVIAHVAQESPHGVAPAVEYVMDGDSELRDVQIAIARGEAAGKTDLHDLYERMELIDGYTAQSRAARLLHGLGFAPEEYSKPVEAFSGGWRMRLNLARALMCRSDILLLDEPTNHLDLPAILWLERWLRAYEGVLLVISHDRDFLDAVCTRMAHIEHRALQLYTGNYSEFEKIRAEQLALQQAMHVRQQKQVKHLQSFVDRFRYKASKAKQAQSRLKMIERMEQIAPAHVDSQFSFRFAEPTKQPQHLLSLRDVSVGYGETTVLGSVNLTLAAGDRIGLLGVNGAGKSTLVKALSSGTTLLTGERTLAKDTHIGYFAQHQLELLDPEQSPIELLRRVAPDDREQDHRNFLGRFAFNGERIFEPVSPFSGGEKARLVLALLIRQGPNLLLLDEPTNHLDLEMRQALSIALMEYAGAVVVISHDRHLLRSACDELLIVHDGKVDRFAESLDEYPNWLKERETEYAATVARAGTSSARGPNKKDQRKAQAEERKRLKPLLDRVKRIEKELSTHRERLLSIESQLADTGLYADSARRDALKSLLKEQGEHKALIETLEWEWLEASEALEAAGCTD
ncbi:MAG: ATP-binding cassette domain-containing protein [Pseudomonadota bacterium]